MGSKALLSPEAIASLLERRHPEGMRRLMGLAWAQTGLAAGLPARPHLIAIDGRSHCLAHGQAMVRPTPKTITLRCPVPRLHRPAAEALAEAGAFGRFDLAELQREHRIPTAFDLAGPGRAAHPNQSAGLAAAGEKGYQQEKAGSLAGVQPSQPRRGPVKGARLHQPASFQPQRHPAIRAP